MEAMGRHTVFFLYFSFLGLFSCYLSSNPETVMVQSPEDNEEKIGKLQFKERLPKTSAVSETPRNVVVKIMRPVVIGSEVYWKEVDSQSFSRIQSSSQYRDSWRYFRPSQSSSRRTNEERVVAVNVETPVSAERFKMPQNGIKGSSGTNVDDDRSQIPGSTYRGKSGTNVDDDRSQIPGSTYRGKSGTNVDDDRSAMPQNTYRGNSRTDSGDDRARMPQINLRGYGRTNSGDDRSLIPQSNLNGNREINGKDDSSQMPQNNFKGNSGINRGDDRSSTPDGKVEDTNSPEILGDTFNVFTEGGEAFFEDDHQANPVPSSPTRISADSNFFAGIVNDFAFKLVESLNLESNFVISPLSIYIALSMCYLGSDGRTKAQIEQALGMNDKGVHDAHLHQGIKNLMSLIMERTSGYELFAANGMFFGRNFTTESSFEQNIKNYYDAEIKNLDFTNPDLSLEFINKWMSDSTRNMISKIINSPPPFQTRLLLLNAIFFKGIWKTHFPIHLTNPGSFLLLDETSKEVPFMRLFDEAFPMVRSDEHKHTFIKLPYEGNQVSMIIALPYTAREKPISSIRDEILCYVRDAMVETKLDFVAIPKFRLEYRISLIRPLQKLGMTDIFNRNVINFRKMRKENDVYVSGVMHKSIIEIDEVGTIASASTAVGLEPLAYQNRTKFLANHPFAFYIIHEPTGLVLFYGKIFDIGSAPTSPNNRREDIRGRPRPIPNRRG